jgi:non-canonical (house-cleaning) NTP pyrophosphatase
MHFAIGTTNKPKSEAVEQVLTTSSYTSWATFSNHRVSSGISDMPLSLREIRTWAQNRAVYCREEYPDADYYVGMEGWVYQDYEGENYWIMGVVYIENQAGEWHYGYSYHLEIPPRVVALLTDGRGLDLEQIMHSLGAPENIGDAGGSPSHWSDGMLVRKDEFIYATQAALAPFFNQYYR